jgi:hypothetical protein
VGEWYWIGLTTAIGVGAGVLSAAFLARGRSGAVLAVLIGAAAGLGAGFGLDDWDEAVGGAAGGIAGAIAAAPFVAGSLRRGGTSGGVALLVGGAGLVLAACGLVPGLGYAEVVLLPLLGLRLRRRAGERYAGLRILAKD